MGTVIFYILAAIAIASALMVVTRKNAINAALFLVATMGTIACLYIQLGSIFIATLQIIVYAGAIIVLFIFVIMLLNLKRDEFGFDNRVFQRIIGVVIGFILLILLARIAYLYQPFYPAQTIDPEMGNAAAMSKKLFLQYLYPFEIISVLLLAAIVGAVVLAKKREEDN
jgi:NADH-quinone oxidoreductase subunit J